MNIIFGRENIDNVDQKYTILELDTFNVQPPGRVITAFCLIENIPILNLPRVDSMKNLHHNLMENYRKKDWNYCEQALDHLAGFWGEEMDSFYNDVKNRINYYKNNDPGNDWDGFITKPA